MAYKVKVTDEAKVDLDEILRHIAETLSNKNAAARLLDDFEKQKNNLKDSPYMYSVCNDSRLQKKGYHRFIFYKNYVALYLINESDNENEKTVNIMHVFYAKRDYARLV